MFYSILVIIFRFFGFFGFRERAKSRKNQNNLRKSLCFKHISDSILDFLGFSGFGSRNPDVLECEPRPGPVSKTYDFAVCFDNCQQGFKIANSGNTKKSKSKFRASKKVF